MTTNFYGLTGPSRSRDAVTSLLDRMRLQPDAGEDVATLSTVRDAAGVQTAGPNAEQILVDQPHVIGAFSGAPYWSHTELAELAKRTSFANSLATAYRRDNTDFLQHLAGPFSLALIDPERNEAVIAIDRMGIGQIYYSYDSSEGLVFGSSARFLQAHGGIAAQLSQQAIYNYLYFHMIPSPGSIFENQEKLGPGEYLAYRLGGVERNRYWSPTFNEKNGRRRHELEEELRELLQQSVRRCIADDSTGCFLSGGIDSSTVAGLLSELERPAKSFTIGFREKGYDETAFARITSEHFGTEQTEYFVSPQDVVDILPRIAESYDEPFGNSSVVPTYYCARTARQNGVSTLLAGDGGDELFGGNVRYITQSIFGVYDRIPQWLKSALIEPVTFGLPGAARFPPTRKMQSYIRQAKVPMPDRLETYNYFSRTPVHDILHPAFLNSVRTDEPIALLQQVYQSSQAPSMLNKMLELDWKFTLADNDLRKVNQMAALAGIEVRYPFLDDDLVEFSTRVPPGMKIRLMRLRDFFKRAMTGYLPKSVLQKPKHGFGLPFGIWMKSYAPLRELAYDNLSDIGKRDSAYLDKLVKSHQSAHAHYYGEFIWVLMMLELWLKNHDARSSAASISG